MKGSCPLGELSVPDLVSTSTEDSESEFSSSCGGGGAPDVSYTFTAPADGTYHFTATSPDGVVDPILAVFDGVCSGEEITCNNNFAQAPDTAARVEVALAAGEVVTVVVDGFSVSPGAVDLEVLGFISEGCPDGDLGATTSATVSGSTAMTGDDAFSFDCGGAGASDAIYSFTAPEAGFYAVDTAGSAFDTVLSAVESCSGGEFICNDDVDKESATSAFTLPLAAGQQVFFAVDGADGDAGDFTLNVGDFDACPDLEIPSALPVQISGTNEGSTTHVRGECGGNGPEVAYSFVPPATGTYVFDTFPNEGMPILDTVLYVYEGTTCGSAEPVGCNEDADILSGYSRLIVDLVGGQPYTVLVDGWSVVSIGDYVLNVELQECGNGTVEFGESCDTDALEGEDCLSLGFGGGTLACSETCEFDTSACETCGTSTVEGTDQCDGVALGEQTCADFGFAGGALDCADDCTVDTAQCSDDVVVYCSSPELVIDSAISPTLDTISVPDIGTVADVDLFVFLTHTWSRDLNILLSAEPLGVSNDIVLGQCGPADDMFAFFNDEGSANAGEDCVAPFAIEGNLLPAAPLSAYDGSSAEGDWTLSVTDTFPGDVGTLHDWCIYFTLE